MAYSVPQRWQTSYTFRVRIRSCKAKDNSIARQTNKYRSGSRKIVKQRRKKEERIKGQNIRNEQ